MDGYRLFRHGIVVTTVVVVVTLLSGCGPTYRELRRAGQSEVASRNWGAARHLFEEAHTRVPEDAENLHDMAVCSIMLARKRLEDGNRSAAMREIDRAIHYYDRALTAHPGFRPAIIGKNRAQELRGQSEEALKSAHWAANFVGPSAKQQIFLAGEYEERGDVDGAFLRLQQALAMEPDNPAVHNAFGDFYRRQGERKTAIRAYRRSLKLDPAQPDVVKTLREIGAFALPGEDAQHP